MKARTHFLTGIAALFLATGTVHANDALPPSIEDEYCPHENEALDPDTQILYQPADNDCAHRRPTTIITFTTTGFERVFREIKCRFTEIKKLAETTYRISASCIDSHSVVSPTKNYVIRFDLQIIDRDLLLTYLSEG